MTIKSLYRNIDSCIRHLSEDIARAAAKAAPQDVKENFRIEGNEDDSGRITRWPTRWYDMHPTPSGKPYGYPIFNQGKEPLSTLRARAERGNRSFKSTVIRTNWEYAKVHNEGGQTRGRWKQSYYGIDHPAPVVPERPFMKPGKRTFQAIEEEIDKILTRFL